VDVPSLSHAVATLKRILLSTPEIMPLCCYPSNPELRALYGIIVQDASLGSAQQGTEGAETGICFFADGQIDRSPCGSGVSARVALAVALGKRKVGEGWTYHSMMSLRKDVGNAFCARAVEELELKEGNEPIRGFCVEVMGRAYYTGSSTFVAEEGDDIGSGFMV
jgi:trans-L-3-hydroxyproline dehydratase